MPCRGQGWCVGLVLLWSCLLGMSYLPRVVELQLDSRGAQDPVLVLYWTPWWKGFPLDGYSLTNESCQRPDQFQGLDPSFPWCQFTHNRKQQLRADLLVFHYFDVKLNELPQRIRGQPWVLQSQEAPVRYPFGIGFHSKFNFMMSYRFDSHIPNPYADHQLIDRVLDPIPDAVFNQSLRKLENLAPVLWVASNCRSFNGREVYIQELMKYIRVDSYGTCLNTRALPNGMSKADLLRAGYKFYLTFENSNCKDYVSEKLFQVLRAGILPVVYGPDDYSGFIPDSHSVIYARDFPSPQALAEFLIQLDQNDDLYRTFFQYKNGGELDPAFLHRWDPEMFRTRYNLCGVCHLAEKRVETSEMIRRDTSCHPSKSMIRLLNRDENVSINFSTPVILLGFSLLLSTLCYLKLRIRFPQS